MDAHSFLNKVFQLSQSNVTYLNIDALFSDTTAAYVEPEVPQAGKEVTIKLRTGKDNVERAFICLEFSLVKMRKYKTKGAFDYYEGTLLCSDEKISYGFYIVCDGRKFYYNRQGVTKHINRDYNFTVIPDFETPNWAKGAVMYQIYVDRFCDGDSVNNVTDNEYCYLGVKAKAIKDWYSPLENLDVCNFYGGDIQGVMNKLDYLKDLGVQVIYLNPVFVSPSNHKYDIQDYDNIDPHYGRIIKDGGEPVPPDASDNTLASKYTIRTTESDNLKASNALFKRFVEKAHKKGIRVILDGVFNHCGAFNKWLDKEGIYERNGYPTGAYADENSIYHDFFKWHDENWPNNESYDGWWGHSNHPKLYYEQSPELVEYILNVAKKWVSPPYNCDGWRLDVAADLGFSREYNMRFWRMFRNTVKQANPDAIIIAEHYGDPQPWLEGDQWDTVMNYDAFMEPITWFLTGMEKHSEKSDPGRYNDSAGFENAMRYYSSRFGNQSLSVAMNELSNHDHSRFLTRTNRKVGRLHTNGSVDADTGVNIGIMYEAITFQMTWQGAPTIYYGDEAGVTGWTDPDNRRTYPWGRENQDILLYYKTMIAIHKKHKVFSHGSTDYLYMNYGIISYGRWDENEKIAVILNNNDEARYVDVPVWRLECENGDVFVNIVCSGINGWHHDDLQYTVREGNIHIKMAAFSSMVLKRMN